MRKREVEKREREEQEKCCDNFSQKSEVNKKNKEGLKMGEW